MWWVRYAWLAAVAVLVTTTIFMSTPVTRYHRGFDSDGVYYGAMAGEVSFAPELARVAPFCHRILTPWVVSQLSGPVLGGFRRLAFLSCVINLLLVALLVGRSGAGLLATGLAILLYAGVYWTVKFSAYSPAYVDFQTQSFLLAVALFAPLSGARWWLIPVFVLGVLQKEALLAFLPFALLASLRDSRPTLCTGAAWASLLIVLPLGTALVVRLAVMPVNAYRPTEVLEYLRLFREPGYGLRLLHAGISGLGLLPLVALLRPEVSWRRLRADPEWTLWLGTAAILLFGGIDKERLFLYALPGLLVLVAAVTAALQRSVSTARFVAWAVITLGVHAWLGHQLEPITGFAEYVARMVPTHASAAHSEYLRRDSIGILAWLVVSVALLRPVPPALRAAATSSTSRRSP